MRWIKTTECSLLCEKSLVVSPKGDIQCPHVLIQLFAKNDNDQMITEQLTTNQSVALFWLLFMNLSGNSLSRPPALSNYKYCNKEH